MMPVVIGIPTIHLDPTFHSEVTLIYVERNKIITVFRVGNRFSITSIVVC